MNAQLHLDVTKKGSDRCLLSTQISPGALRHPKVPSERVPCQTCALHVTLPLTL
jgi:hypothetical protein